MPLSIFVDALPYTEIYSEYSEWFDNMQVSKLLPNIAYSSSLHWQLYCNKYPDERGVLVDWVRKPEKRKSVRVISTLLSPLDYCGDLGALSRKLLDRFVYRKNVFANIPYKFRKDFSEEGKYLFWDKETYGKEPIFSGYTVVSQDEGHISFNETITRLDNAIAKGDKNIFAVFGFADSIGHKCRRGEIYSKRLKPCMDKLKASIEMYKEKHLDEEILIVSDHGMSTVETKIDLGLEKRFGKQSKKSYIAYSDTAVMCIWTEDKRLKSDIGEYLKMRTEGHLLDGEERERFGATDKKFGDIIYILREGNVFEENWFGKSMRKPSPDGAGMHGFWPEWEARDQIASVILINGRKPLDKEYDYPAANKLIERVMSGERR